MNLKHAFLKILVWNMRWMTRYFGFIARPFIAWYADQEIIACGLRSEKGDVCIIYTPTPERTKHLFFKKEKKWTAVRVIAAKNFSGDLVHQIILPDAQLNETYIVEAKKKNKRHTLRSPTITIKEKTHREPDLIKIKKLPDGRIHISWVGGEQYNPMIYFLVLEDDHGNALAGIYTREYFWRYPSIKEASLSVGRNDPPLLQKDMRYTVKLAIVDFDGWVGCASKKVFTY